MNKSRVHFLYQDLRTRSEVLEFLEPYYLISNELISFPLEGIKTKVLYSQIDQLQASNPFDFLLVQYGTGLEIFDAMKRRIAIDFDNDKLNYARKVFTKDPLLQAIGKKRKRVLDVSAGLGIDSVFLAKNGHEVIAYERNPLLFLLLSEAKKNSQVLSNFKIRFEFGEASNFFSSAIALVTASPFDCIYYDPMFPEKHKTALPRQEMVLFRQLVGNDLDSGKVLEILINSGSRVVVKRPANAEPILANPSFTHKSKLIRFDIYEGKQNVHNFC